MKRVIALVLSAVLSNGAFAAGQQGGTTTTTTQSTTTTRTNRKRAARAMATAADVQALKDALAAQQQQINQLQQELRSRDQVLQQVQQSNQVAQQAQQQVQQAANEAQQKASAAETAANEQKASVGKLSNDIADMKSNVTNIALGAQEEQKRVSGLEGVIGHFRFTGDVRVRGENFFQSYLGCTKCFDRNRARVRVRFGFDGKLNEDFMGGIAVATGSLGDPSTTNETLTNFFDRKTIGLDRGYITYNPLAHRWLSLTGGKFAYTWQRTSVIFDPDINPEGFSEKLSWDLKTPGLKNVSLQGLELLGNDNNNGSFLRAHDSFAVGGQLAGRVDLGFMTSTPSVLVLNWRNIDAILNASAFAVQATTTGNAPTSTTPVSGLPVPGEGQGCASGSELNTVPPCTFAPNGMTNATFIGGDGKPHFASQFLYGDLILNNQFKTGIARLPFNLLLEAEQNLRAAGHPIGSNNRVRTDLGRQSHVYLVDASIGQIKNKGDFQVGYAWLQQQQDAVLSSFAESDQRAPTNILQHRVYGLYKLRANTVASYTLWIGRSLNPSLQHAALAPGWTTALGANEPWLKRMQFDLIYSF